MPARKTAYLRSDRVGQLFVAISVYTVLLWTAYPIIWALAEGTNVSLSLLPNLRQVPVHGIDGVRIYF